MQDALPLISSLQEASLPEEEENEELNSDKEYRGSTADRIVEALLERVAQICENNERLKKTETLLNASTWQTHPFYDEKEKDPLTRSVNN